MNYKLQKILLDINTYINEKESNKKWIAGTDWVQYSGPHFTSDEYVRAIKTILNGL